MAVTTEVRPMATAARLVADRRMPLVALASAAGLLAAIFRLVGLRRALDVFVDEPLYVALGHSVHAGGFPTVNGSAFFLHPPGFFYLQAIWERLFGHQADIVAGVYEMRSLNAILAGGTAAALVLLVARAGSLRAAAATGALFALDPFCIRQNGRVLLETAMMFWVLVGYVVLLPLADYPAWREPRVRAVYRPSLRWVVLPPLADNRPAARSRVRAVCGGLLFGLAMLTKDEAVLITILPLLAAAALRWRSPRRPFLLLAAGATAVPYALYVITVAVTGHFGEFWAQKGAGIERLLGLLQITGFNAPHAPSLTSRLADEMRYFGTTYALLAASLVALVFLLRRGNPSKRLLALFYASAVVLLAYAVVLGTLEEQELYVMVVPALVALGLAGAQLIDRYGHNAWFRGATLSLLGLVLAVNLTTYVQWRVQPDNGYALLRQYMKTHVPAGSAVTAADGGAAGGSAQQELGPSAWVLRDRYQVGTWVTPQARAQAKVRYLIVPWKVVDEGYSYLPVETVRSLTQGAEPLFSVSGRTYGRLVLYRLPELPAPQGDGEAPPTGEDS